MIEPCIAGVRGNGPVSQVEWARLVRPSWPGDRRGVAGVGAVSLICPHLSLILDDLTRPLRQ